jgi:protocatechuate 3,4-dioxygenase beta subunit
MNRGHNRPQADEDDDRTVGRVLSRREALVLLGAAGAVLLPACGSSGDSATTTSPTTGAPTTGAPTTAAAAAAGGAAAPACVVKPELTEGPYFVDEKLNRSDIRPDPSTGAVSEGTPLQLAFRVSSVAAGGCAALAGAMVDVWHCDAAGRYSDVSANDTVGQKFLRGYQVTDAGGAASFTTVFPGWYQGRAVHIHFKIRTGGYDFTSQLFFDDPVLAEAFSQAPYASRGAPGVTNARDGIYRSGGSQLVLPATKDGSGYAGTFDIGLQLT